MTILRLPLMPADVWSTLSPDPVPEVELGLHTIEGVDHYTADTDHCDESIPVKELTLVSMVSRLSELIDREIDTLTAMVAFARHPPPREGWSDFTAGYARARREAKARAAARAAVDAPTIPPGYRNAVAAAVAQARAQTARGVVPTARARPAEPADAWWTWHDQDSSRASATMREAEQRCAAWVAGTSDDGPARAGLADEMTATATVTADGSMSVAFRGATATSKLSSMEPTIMAAHATRMLSEMSPPTDDDLHGPTGPLSVFVRIEYTVGGNRAGAGLLARAECGSSDDRRWVRWGLA